MITPIYHQERLFLNALLGFIGQHEIPTKQILSDIFKLE